MTRRVMRLGHAEVDDDLRAARLGEVAAGEGCEKQGRERRESAH
jgi:hypothetical protein